MTYTEFSELKENPESSARGAPCLTMDPLLDVIIKKKKYLLLYLYWDLFSVVSSNRYLPKGSNANVIGFTITGSLPSWRTLGLHRRRKHFSSTEQYF